MALIIDYPSKSSTLYYKSNVFQYIWCAIVQYSNAALSKKKQGDMTKNLLPFLFILVISCSSRNMQNETLKLSLHDAEVDFLSFNSLVSGQAVFNDAASDSYNAGHRYRVFISLYEIYCVVFIDKISLNIEGGHNEMLWFRKINLDDIYSKYSFHEETDCFIFLEWTENDKFSFRIKDKKFLGVINENGEWLEVMLL